MIRIILLNGYDMHMKEIFDARARFPSVQLKLGTFRIFKKRCYRLYLNPQYQSTRMK